VMPTGSDGRARWLTVCHLAAGRARLPYRCALGTAIWTTCAALLDSSRWTMPLGSTRSSGFSSINLIVSGSASGRTVVDAASLVVSVLV